MISPTPAFGAPEQFETGPLSWVMAEIRAALDQSVRAMTEALALAGDSQLAALTRARLFVHQAHGALAMVEINGLTAITRSAEDILDRMLAGSHTLVPADVEDLAAAYQALNEYLEELVAGGPHQPVRLYPYYRTLLTLAGADRIHPSELFFPQRRQRAETPLRLAGPPSGASDGLDLATLRQRYEKALLPFLKSTDRATEQENAALMGDIIAEIEDAQEGVPEQDFWQVMHGFAALVSGGQLSTELAGDKQVKQLFARINMQLRKLAKPPFVIDQVLLRDALFFIAAAENPTALTEQIRGSYGVSAITPADYERKRYGQVDTFALAEARRHLAEAKSGWSRISGGDESAIEGFEQAMAALAAAAPALKSPPLAKLLGELAGIARRAAVANGDDGLALEMAGSLLFVENALNHTSRLAEDFAQRAEALTARLLALVAGEHTPTSVQWLDEMSRAAHERETMAALTGQMKSNLAQVEKVLDAYFTNPAKLAELATVDPALQQIEGILAVLDQGQAARAVAHTRIRVAKFSSIDDDAARAQEQAEGAEDAEDAEDGEIIASVPVEVEETDYPDFVDHPLPTAAQQRAFRQVAQNIGALSFFIETLQNNPDAARSRFSFDQATGVFHANLIGQLTAQLSVPVPVPVPAEQGSDEPRGTAGTDTVLARSGAELAAGSDQGAVVATETGTTAGSGTRTGDKAESDAAQLAALPDVSTTQAAPGSGTGAGSDSDFDAELLEIFLGEATEVLAFVGETLPLLKQAPHSLEHMTAIRRSFHTLKGSGRMVGLMAFGEAAWSVERVLNLKLAESKPGDDGLYVLIEQADALLGAWVTDLQTTGNSTRDGAALIAAAERLLAGEQEEAVSLGEPAFEFAPAPEVSVDSNDSTGITDTAGPAGRTEVPETTEQIAQTGLPATAEEAATSGVQAALPVADDSGVETLPHVYVEQDADLIEEGLPELESETSTATEVSSNTAADAQNSDVAAKDVIVSESLAEQVAESADAQQDAVGDTGDIPEHPPEVATMATVIGFPDRQTAEAPPDDSIKRIGSLEISMPLYNIYLAETDELVRLLANDLAEWRHEPERRVSTDAVNAAHSLTGSSATVGFAALQELAHAHELLLLTLARLPDPLRPFEFDAVSTAIDCMKRMLSQFALGELAGPELRQVQALQELKSRILARAVPMAREESEDDEIEAFAVPGAGHSLEDDLDADIDLDIDFDLGTGFMVPASVPASPPTPAQQQEIAASIQIDDLSDATLKALADDLEHNETVASSASPLAVQAMGEDEAPTQDLDLDLDLDAEIPPEEEALDSSAAGGSVAEEPAISEDQAIEAAAAAGMYLEDSPFDGAGLSGQGAEQVAGAEDQAAAANDENLDAVSALLAAAVEVEAQAGSELATTLGQQDNALPNAIDAIGTIGGIGVAPELIDEVSIRPVVLPEHLAQAAETLYEHERGQIAGAALSMPRDELDLDLLPVFIEEANDILPEMGSHLRQLQQNPQERESVAALLRLLHTIKGSARMAGAMVLGQNLHEMESRIEQLTLHGAPSPAGVEELLGRLDMALALFERLSNPDAGQAGSVAPSTVAGARSGVDHAAGEAGAGTARRDAVPKQTAQPSFATTATAAAPAQQTPAANEALTQVAAQLAPAASEALTQVAAQFARAAMQAPAVGDAAAPSAPIPLVRVRADLLDRLVNQAGEVSISRSRIESDVAFIKSSLAELGDNVLRLQGQLREIEIQAETQMASQMQQATDREFDPLEFDRFTRLQELTRIMAESVNDVASVQQNLSRTADDTSHNLVQQARFTRDLQQDLMRVRMVQFTSISERLYRITRQASKELDKRVNLDIRGGAVEIDRSVLEKMTGPFEHLLRNSIVHGIESRAERSAAGKNETGELLVEVRQAGNEVVIHVSDDGRGLDLARIAEKARATGLMSVDSEPSEAEVRDMIFHPGFSTAREITELAGRGIGMDVVRAEAVSLGGRITIDSTAGKGAQFTIHLPLTLAVTQVVVLSTGGKTYAVPSVLVEQVQQLKSTALASAYNDGAIKWLNQHVPLFYLSGLLGDTATAPLTQQYSPVLILKSGTERVAIHVDAVLGNREVVIKNIGPQLARMPGVAGATVLGAGDIVLILDPVPLAQRQVSDPARAARVVVEASVLQGSALAAVQTTHGAEAPIYLGAVADMAGASLDGTAVLVDDDTAEAVSLQSQDGLPDQAGAGAVARAAGQEPATGDLSSSTVAADAAASDSDSESEPASAPATPAQKKTAAQTRAGKARSEKAASARAETGAVSAAAPTTPSTTATAPAAPATPLAVASTRPAVVPPAGMPVQGLRTQRTVMVVDDSLTVRRVTQRMLVREGYQVVLAKDGVDALEQLQAITPDVMLVDIEMPRMDGFDLTRNVRGDERTRAIPIIMITSRTAVKHRTYAMELGVNEYLGKPYQETELLGLVAGFMQKEAAAG